MEHVTKNTLKLNIVANFILRLWSVASIFIFIPLYIKFLGEEAYGLVTFFSTLQTVMNLLGMGLSKTLRREFASLGYSDEAKLGKYKLLRSVETVYTIIAGIIILLCSNGAELIATQWLTIEYLPISIAKTTIVLMGISIAIQLITGMLQGCLFGMEKQVEADSIQFGWSLFRNVGVILLLWLFHINLIVFYLWYIFIDFIYLVVLRLRVVYYLRPVSLQLEWHFIDISNLKNVWKYAFGLFFISLCTIGFDKLIVSKSFDLTTVGAYNTIAMLGNFSLIISTSVGIAVFSRFAALKAGGKEKELLNLYGTTNKIVNICVGCLGGFIAVYSNEIILFWTHSQEIANISKNSAQLIIIGLTFQALQQISYEYMLATGIVVLDNIRAIFTVLALLIGMPIMINNSGFYGAAIAICVILVFVSIVYVGIINAWCFSRNPVKIVFSDLILPFTFPGFVALLSHKFVVQITSNTFYRCFLGGLIGAVSLILILIVANNYMQFVDLRSLINKINGQSNY